LLIQGLLKPYVAACASSQNKLEFPAGFSCVMSPTCGVTCLAGLITRTIWCRRIRRHFSDASPATAGASEILCPRMAIWVSDDISGRRLSTHIFRLPCHQAVFKHIPGLGLRGDHRLTWCSPPWLSRPFLQCEFPKWLRHF
jgi:hypothetical protein